MGRHRVHLEIGAQAYEKDPSVLQEGIHVTCSCGWGLFFGDGVSLERVNAAVQAHRR